MVVTKNICDTLFLVGAARAPEVLVGEEFVAEHEAGVEVGVDGVSAEGLDLRVERLPVLEKSFGSTGSCHLNVMKVKVDLIQSEKYLQQIR